MEKNIYKNLLLLLVSLLLLFIFLEIGFRFISPPRQTQYDPLFGTSIKPNLQVHFQTAEFSIDYSSNALGFRDKEHPVEKEEGVYRIAVIGDSFTEALQVESEERFSDILEKVSPKVEVINFGTGSWGTDQEWLAYQQKVKQFKPDLVILMFVYNDFETNLLRVNKPYYTLENGLTYHPAEFSYNPWWRQILSSSEFLTQMANYAYKAKMRFTAKGSEQLPYALQIALPEEDYSPEVKEAILLTDALLKNFAEEVQRDGADFLLVSVPPAPAVEESSWEKFRLQYPKLPWEEIDFSHQEKILSEDALEGDFSFLGLLEPLRKYKERTGESLYFEKDEHWNAQGHLVAAAVLKKKVEGMK